MDTPSDKVLPKVTPIPHDTLGKFPSADQPTAEQIPIPSLDQVFPEKFGQYRVMKLLGKGGMGNVYLAEDPVLKRRVAIKTLRPELAMHQVSKERFLREACMVSAIKHEHIVTIYNVGEEQGIPYLAMEFLEGQSLEEIIQKKKRLNWIQIMRLGREIARGLAVAHANGLIHRDVKPANIWLEVIDKQAGKTRLKLLDFGLAKYAQQEGGVTQAGMVVGTPHYVSPEQARGKELDPRSDLFSMGVVLYRLCTRKYPFEGEDTLSLLTSLAVDDPQPMRNHKPDIPEALDDFVLRLLAKNPADRPGSAKEVADILQDMYHAESKRNKNTVAKPPVEKDSTETPKVQEVTEEIQQDVSRQTLMFTLVALIAICSVALIALLIIKILSH